MRLALLAVLPFGLLECLTSGDLGDDCVQTTELPFLDLQAPLLLKMFRLHLK